MTITHIHIRHNTTQTQYNRSNKNQLDTPFIYNNITAQYNKLQYITEQNTQCTQKTFEYLIKIKKISI